MVTDFAGGQVSRRRVIQGAAWSAPIIVLATSAPARAASLATGGLRYIGFDVHAIAGFWVTDANGPGVGATLPVTLANANLQNVPGSDPPNHPAVTQFDLTFSLPVGAIASPRWGLGSNSQGIASPATWSLVSGPTVSAGVATITFRWTGSMGNYGNTQPTVWIEAVGSQAGLQATTTVVAIHTGGLTSSDARAATVLSSTLTEWIAAHLFLIPPDWLYMPGP